MKDNFYNMMEMLTQDDAWPLAVQGKWGLEKEALRINRDASLALTPHPDIFGDKLKNPYVQTDFSESQIELITPPFSSMERTYEFLKDLHLKAESAIGDELLWPLSMPGPLPDDEGIPIARYNSTPEGREKESYRSGLAMRYGKKMQMISGIHYNFSFHESFFDYLYGKAAEKKDKRDFMDELYFSMARNFLRYRWLPLLITGASPVADNSYRDGVWEQRAALLGLSDEEDYLRHATSLRMSPLGYTNAFDGPFRISHNSLDGYIRDFRSLLAERNPRYSGSGIVGNGDGIQLNDRMLQIENEYYSPIRFKQTMDRNERLLDALESRGVRHVELRIFDLDPYEKTGISLDMMRFIHVFILFCLFEKSEPLDEDEELLVNFNSHRISLAGRNEGLRLMSDGGMIPLADETERIFKKLNLLAEYMGKGDENAAYKRAVQRGHEMAADPISLPSSRIVHEMKSGGESYAKFGLRMAGELGMAGPPFDEAFKERVIHEMRRI